MENAQRIYSNRDSVEEKQNKRLAGEVMAVLRETEKRGPRGGSQRCWGRKKLDKDQCACYRRKEPCKNECPNQKKDITFILHFSKDW